MNESVDMTDVEKMLTEVREAFNELQSLHASLEPLTQERVGHATDRAKAALSAFTADMPGAIGGFIQAAEDLRLVVMFRPVAPPANKMIAAANKAIADSAAKEYDAALAKLRIPSEDLAELEGK